MPPQNASSKKAATSTLTGKDRHKAYQIIRQEAIRRLIEKHEADYDALLATCKTEAGFTDTEAKAAPGSAWKKLTKVA